jgi:hypothetical protein
VKAPLSIRPRAKAWTSTWAALATDSTLQVEKAASVASASFLNRAVCVRRTRVAAFSSMTSAVAVWCPARQDDAMTSPPPGVISADSRYARQVAVPGHDDQEVLVVGTAEDLGSGKGPPELRRDRYSDRTRHVGRQTRPSGSGAYSGSTNRTDSLTGCDSGDHFRIFRTRCGTNAPGDYLSVPRCGQRAEDDGRLVPGGNLGAKYDAFSSVKHRISVKK